MSFGKENVDKFTIATLVNLEFGWVKYWQMTFVSPKFSSTKILCYTIVSYIPTLCMDAHNYYVIGFGKTDHNVTIDISRNTNLKYTVY